MLLFREITKLEPDLREAILEKFYRAEKKIAILRTAVVLINFISFVFFEDITGANLPLAYSILALSIVYSILTLIIEPYRRFRAFFSTYFTSISDITLIILWMYSIGPIQSTYFPLWILSIIAISYRFLYSETLATTALYSICFVIVTLVTSDIIDIADFIIKLGYLIVAGIICAFISRDTVARIKDKIQLRHSEQQLEASNAELEQRVKERTEELEEINKELESFAYIVSHDLKAPLRAISTVADWIVEDHHDNLNDDIKSQLTLIRERSARMKDLIDGILRLSRATRSTEEKQLLKPEEVIQEVTELIAVPEKFSVNVIPPLPQVYMERTLFLQLVENLVVNAIRYNDKPRGVIEISGKDEGDATTICIRDNGPGIPEAQRDNVFQLFNTGTSKSGEGTGIGLAIVKKIIDKSGGKIRVDSSPGEGAKFCFTIPKAKHD